MNTHYKDSLLKVGFLPSPRTKELIDPIAHMTFLHDVHHTPNPRESPEGASIYHWRAPTGLSCWKFILLKRAWYPKQPFFGRMFDKTTVFYVMIWSHPTETTVKKWFFGVPGGSIHGFLFFVPPKKWQVG